MPPDEAQHLTELLQITNKRALTASHLRALAHDKRNWPLRQFHAGQLTILKWLRFRLEHRLEKLIPHD